MTRLPAGIPRIAEELLRRQSPVVPNGQVALSRRLVSVVMNVPMLPAVPGLSIVDCFVEAEGVADEGNGAVRRHDLAL